MNVLICKCKAFYVHDLACLYFEVKIQVLKNYSICIKVLEILSILYFLYSQSSKDSTKTRAVRMEPSDTFVKCSTEEM